MCSILTYFEQQNYPNVMKQTFIICFLSYIEYIIIYENKIYNASLI